MEPRQEAFAFAFAAITGLAFCINILTFSANLPHAKNLANNSLLSLVRMLFDCLVLSIDVGYCIKDLILRYVDLSDLRKYIDGVVVMVGALTSLLLCLGLTILRYAMVIYQKKLSKQFVINYIVGSIVLVLFVAAIPFIFQSAETSYVCHPSKVYCAFNWTGRDLVTLTVVVITLLILGLPVAFIGFAYLRIYLLVSTVFKTTKDASSVTDPKKETLASYKNATARSLPAAKAAITHSVTINNNNNNNNTRGTSAGGNSFAQSTAIKKDAKSAEEQKQKDLLIQSFVIVGVFITGWTPYLIMMIYEIWMGEFASPLPDFLCATFTTVSQLFNPIILLIYDQDLRYGVLAFFGLKKDIHLYQI